MSDFNLNFTEIGESTPEFRTEYFAVHEDSIKLYKFAKLFRFIQLDLLIGGVYLAGGALRTLVDLDEVVSDYDLFFESQVAAELTRERLKNLGFDLIFECPEGKLFTFKGCGMKIQCVCENYYFTARELISSFDFTACASAFDGNTFWVHRHFARSVRKKTLKLLSLTFPVATLGRIIKYDKKGYKTGKCRLEFVEALQGLFDTGFRLDDKNARFYID